MIVERNFQKIEYPIEQLPVCDLPAAKLKHNFTDTLTWDEIIDTTNKFIMNNTCIKHDERSTINYQIKKVKSQIKKFEPIENLLQHMFPNQIHDTDLYGSYENSTGGFRLHRDKESTVLHIQKGEVIVNVVTGSMSYVFDLKENDMIFIKKGINHSVIGLTPRFLTSYGIHYTDEK